MTLSSQKNGPVLRAASAANVKEEAIDDIFLRTRYAYLTREICGVTNFPPDQRATVQVGLSSTPENGWRCLILIRTSIDRTGSST